MNHWLFKSEPSSFNIDDLANSSQQTTHWDGIRNYQVRNMLRDEIKVGDKVFFYYSNANPPGIAGIMEIVKAGYPDFTAWDENFEHYDAQSPKDKPRWFMVDVCLVHKFKRIISLDELKSHPALKNMLVTRKGNRLSITPVSAAEWNVIIKLENNNSIA